MTNIIRKSIKMLNRLSVISITQKEKKLNRYWGLFCCPLWNYVEESINLNWHQLFNLVKYWSTEKKKLLSQHNLKLWAFMLNLFACCVKFGINLWYKQSKKEDCKFIEISKKKAITNLYLYSVSYFMLKWKRTTANVLNWPSLMKFYKT